MLTVLVRYHGWPPLWGRQLTLCGRNTSGQTWHLCRRMALQGSYHRSQGTQGQDLSYFTAHKHFARYPHVFLIELLLPDIHLPLSAHTYCSTALLSGDSRPHQWTCTIRVVFHGATDAGPAQPVSCRHLQQQIFLLHAASTPFDTAHLRLTEDSALCITAQPRMRTLLIRDGV